MIIKAKYPTVGNEYVGFQGYGAQGNQISDVTRIDRLETLVTVNESLFPNNKKAFNRAFNTAFK
tara:strand:- start:739 stop:930 length:192 start_codon:yes stop_codon:yes gene_type:complete